MQFRREKSGVDRIQGFYSIRSGESAWNFTHIKIGATLRMLNNMRDPANTKLGHWLLDPSVQLLSCLVTTNNQFWKLGEKRKENWLSFFFVYILSAFFLYVYLFFLYIIFLSCISSACFSYLRFYFTHLRWVLFAGKSLCRKVSSLYRYLIFLLLVLLSECLTP